MISLLCLRFMNGVLEWGDKRLDQDPLLKEGYQRISTAEGTTTNKSKHPEASITVHTVQPYGKLKREEESDIPYSEESDEDVEVS